MARKRCSEALRRRGASEVCTAHFHGIFADKTPIPPYLSWLLERNTFSQTHLILSPKSITVITVTVFSAHMHLPEIEFCIIYINIYIYIYIYNTSCNRGIAKNLSKRLLGRKKNCNCNNCNGLQGHPRGTLIATQILTSIPPSENFSSHRFGIFAANPYICREIKKLHHESHKRNINKY